MTETMYERMTHPGTLLVAAGVLVGLVLPPFLRRCSVALKEKQALLIKTVGCIAALLGAVILFL